MDPANSDINLLGCKNTPGAWLAGVCIIVALVSISSEQWLCFVWFLVNVGLRQEWDDCILCEQTQR